jgi:hypothetical protein
MWSPEAGDIYSKGWWRWRKTMLIRWTDGKTAYVTPYPDREGLADVIHDARQHFFKWKLVGKKGLLIA